MFLLRAPVMVRDPLGLNPLFGHTRRRRPDIVLRLKLDPLRLIAAMIYARAYIQFGEGLVHMIGPRLALLLQQRRSAIGRASSRGRARRYVLIRVVAVSLTKKLLITNNHTQNKLYNT